MTVTSAGESASLLRIQRILAVLAAATATGGLAEMAMLRHWAEPGQLLPWLVLAAVIVAAALVLLDRAPRRLGLVVGAAAVVTGGIGVVLHLLQNLEIDPMLARYAQTWDSMSLPERLWAAVNGSIGGAPLLAPGMVTLAGVLLVLAVLDRR
jgi:hypothetical protein